MESKDRFSKDGLKKVFQFKLSVPLVIMYINDTTTKPTHMIFYLILKAK